MKGDESFGAAGAIQRAFEYFAGRAALGFIIPEWLPTPDNLQYLEAVQQLDAAVYSVVESRQAVLNSRRIQPNQQVWPSCYGLDKSCAQCMAAVWARKGFS